MTIEQAERAANDATRATGRYHYADYNDLTNKMQVFDTGRATLEEAMAATDHRERRE